MRFLFELTHPKHFYQFKQLIKMLQAQGHIAKIIARDKDVLLSVLEEEGLTYTIYGKHKKKMGGKIFNILGIFFNYLKIIREFKPHFIISKASFYAVLIKPFTKARLVITPDSEVVWLTRKIVAPLSHIVITPETYTISYGEKQKRIKGFFEECYLSPQEFIANSKVVENTGTDVHKPYFVMRFISWDANHDVGHYGFTDEQKTSLVEKLSRHGEVIISAEQKNIPNGLDKYLSKIPPNEIHHLLHFATLYIGDSQTMATEAALLGTPSLRYNSFVGPNDMSNFIILEKEYDLMRNFRNFDDLMEAIDNMLKNQNLKKEWLDKRERYFASKPNLNEQMMLAVVQPVYQRR